MEELKFSSLKKDVQDIIDLIAQKQYKDANNKLIEANDFLDELIDFSEEDEDLIEISKYQVLLNQLQLKINTGLGSWVFCKTFSQHLITFVFVRKLYLVVS